jgi:EpsI family protein
MKQATLRWTLALLMVATAAIAWAMVPRIYMSQQRPKTAIDQWIPLAFGDWKEVPQGGRQVVNPQQAALLEDIYSQTLSRTYVNTQGASVMLSLAYGANQSRDMQINRPEVCYAAQGFQILSAEKVKLESDRGSIPAMHLVTKQGPRNEPLTYWVRIGEKVVRGNIEQGLARLGYGLGGVMADGILFRVSSIANEPLNAFATQKQFIDDLLKAVPPDTKAYLLGSTRY